MPQSSQEDHYETGYDYWSESPHLKHRHLYEQLVGEMADLVVDPSAARPPEILEIGAGDGAISERLLALGCDITGTEMSRHSVSVMNSRFGSNDRFRALHDPDGDLGCLEGRRFDAVVFASVLHHIPDYLAAVDHAVEAHLRPGGALISIQDPLWYPRMSPTSLRLTNAAYLSWRIGRGNIARGLKTRLRRRFQGLSEEAPGDAVEYHVVRDGVDEEAIVDQLRARFESVNLLTYWSSQGVVQQRLGERLGMVNTFAIFAAGRKANREGDLGQ